MASEKILFISEGKSLILHALQRNLTKNGYELIPCSLDVEALHEHEHDAELILMYLSGEEDSKTDALVYLKDLGCTYGQGYLYAKPMKQEEFEAFMEEHLK